MIYESNDVVKISFFAVRDLEIVETLTSVFKEMMATRNTPLINGEESRTGWRLR